MPKQIKIHPADNVAVALETTEDIPAGHKIALEDISEGGNVIKYGFPIGHVTRDVRKGEMIDHNCLRSNLEGLLEYEYEPDFSPAAFVETSMTFNGFRRASGEVGIRNQIWIIPTVGCVNGIAEKIASLLREEKATGMGSVDAIVAFPHNYGCSQLGDDHESTRRILADLVHHPNAGGVLIVALGCENNQLSSFMELTGPVDPARVRTIEVQKVRGDEIGEGLRLARSIFNVCSMDVRTPVPISELKVGLKCGGSDGFSGITANPLLGMFSDWLTRRKGSAVLTEVPEMFGAERLLMNRCADSATFEKAVRLINGFKEYFIRSGQQVYENPSPGNRAGGISTLEEKSLGCVQKCGTSIVRDVLSYGERLHINGLNLLCAPGNDLVATTALGASGCQIVLFTTGRGTPYGSFVPTIKVSTNTDLAQRKPLWIDFDAGIVTDRDNFDKALNSFIGTFFDIVNGAPARHEASGMREFAIWKQGVTL